MSPHQRHIVLVVAIFLLLFTFLAGMFRGWNERDSARFTKHAFGFTVTILVAILAQAAWEAWG